MTGTPALTIEQVLDAMPKTAARFKEALDEIVFLEAEDKIRKITLTELRQRINRGFENAWDAFIREPYLHNGRYQERTEAENKLVYDTLGLYPEVHTAVGYRKRILAGTKAEGVMRDTMIDLINVLVPIAERVEALKAKIGVPAPKPTKTSIALEERAEKAMTCQICARDILAETGTIAHHGYQRPLNSGYQTASCPGAKQVPFEVSRDALGKHIENLKAYVIREDAFRSRVQAESQDLMWHYMDRSNCTTFWQKGVERFEMVNRANFAEFVAATKEARENARQGTHYAEPDFDRLKASVIERVSADILATEAEIDRQTTRWMRWVQTHERKGGAWVCVEA